MIDRSMVSGILKPLTPRRRTSWQVLVGKKCLVTCKVDGKAARLLCNTRAQVSLVSEDGLIAKLGKLEIDDLELMLKAVKKY